MWTHALSGGLARSGYQDGARGVHAGFRMSGRLHRQFINTVFKNMQFQLSNLLLAPPLGWLKQREHCTSALFRI